MRILGLSTSTARGSVAFARPSGAVASSYADLQGHAERLFAAIDAALAETGETRASIDAIAVDVGPGSFTGVRVGVASAKGIALGLGVPLAGVGSLEAMAAAAYGERAAAEDAIVLAAIDAKKGELFVAAFDPSGHAVCEPSSCVASADAVVAQIDGVRARCGSAPVVLVGEVFATLALPGSCTFPRGASIDLPDAGWVAKVASARLAAIRAGGPEAPVEPHYVRPPDATPPAKPPPVG